MKNPIKDATKKSILIGLTLVYVVGLFFARHFMLAANGFFMIALVVIGLEQWTAKRILITVSPVLTYPLFLMIAWFSLPLHWVAQFVLPIVVYGIIYGFLFRNLWGWIVPKVCAILASTLLFLSVSSLSYGYIVVKCADISSFEKGVTRDEIANCRVANLYVPTSSDRFSGFAFALAIVSNGPSVVAGILLLNYLFVFDKRKKRTLAKKGQRNRVTKSKVENAK